MKRVTGIGGIFFKCEDTAKTKEWYEKHLGIPAGAYGHMFEWRELENPETVATTTWSPFSKTSGYFGKPEQQFMVNYRVENLSALIEALKAEGVELAGEMQEYDYGKFAWILDPDGNKIELWEPIDQPLIDEEKKD